MIALWAVVFVAVVIAFLAGAACYGLVGYITLLRCMRSPDRSEP